MSNELQCDNKAEHQYDQEDDHEQHEMLLDPGANGVTPAIEHDRLDEEAGAAGDDREQDEQPEIVTGESGGDGDELVGDRRHALDQDDQRSPFRIGFAEGLDAIAEMIEADQPLPDD